MKFNYITVIELHYVNRITLHLTALMELHYIVECVLE